MAAVTAAMLLTACGGGGGGALPTPLDALCAARAATDPAEAARTFTDRAHAPLHTLADTVADIDRAAAARLLEAKQRVEALIEGGAPDPAALAAALDDLIDATRTALAAAGTPAPACPS